MPLNGIKNIKTYLTILYSLNKKFLVILRSHLRENLYKEYYKKIFIIIFHRKIYFLMIYTQNNLQLSYNKAITNQIRDEIGPSFIKISTIMLKIIL